MCINKYKSTSARLFARDTGVCVVLLIILIFFFPAPFSPASDAGVSRGAGSDCLVSRETAEEEEEDDDDDKLLELLRLGSIKGWPMAIRLLSLISLNTIDINCCREAIHT